MPGNERKWRSVRQAQADDEARAGCSSGVGGAPAGGPLVVPGFVSGPIRVHDLQHSWLTLLSVLESDLGDVMMEEFNDPDIVVDDLKIVTDAELVEKALAEVLQGKNALLDCRRLEDGRSQGGEGAHGTAGLEGQSFTGLLLGDDECTHEAGLDKNKTTAQELSIVPFVGVGDNAGQHDGGAALIESGVEPGAELQAIETSQAIVPMQEAGDNAMQHYEGSVALIEAGVEPGAELQAIEASQPKQKEKKRKRGRPYDRDVRAAELEMDAAAIQREEILTRMKQEREAAKQSSNLHSLRFKQEREAADAGNKNQLRKLRFLTTAIKFPTTTTPEVTEEEAVESTEIVLVVELYHGLKKHTKTQEFLVLGSQPLTALRDRLYCLTDELAQEAKLNVPSGYFLIEDVFYNDMRNPKAIDYSEPIIKWTRETKEATERWKAVGGAAGGRKSSGTTNQNSDSVSLPSFRTASMADTSFSDLQLRIGSQYLYCHQGDCKHMLVIRDIRLIHPEDVQKVAAYPVLRWHPRARIRKCSICDIYRAAKITYGDTLAPSSPCFFCEQCYYMLHYNADGSLLYSDFKVYEYHHE